MKLEKKIIVVTGAGNGIGRELVLRLLAKGARVAGVDLNANALQETEALANCSNDRFCGFVANIADRAIESLPEQVVEHFGEVDGLINNAGIIQPFALLRDLDIPTLERVVNVNFFGTVFVIKAFLPLLLQRPEAHIVNLSSMGGFVPVPGQTVYCAAKAGVKLLSEGLASELLNTNVHVTVVFPGAVATKIRHNSGVAAPASEGGRCMQPLSPARAAEMIVAGIERNAYQVFVGADAFLMDKLNRLNPAFAARMIAKKMSGLLPH